MAVCAALVAARARYAWPWVARAGRTSGASAGGRRVEGRKVAAVRFTAADCIREVLHVYTKVLGFLGIAEFTTSTAMAPRGKPDP
eukprot:6155827-Prymnesium_polylepis.1